MKKYLLSNSGTFFKANLHCHTICSDGKYTPEQIKQKYMAQGYAVVAFSDHNRILPHPELASSDFVPLTAIEIDFNAPAEHWSHTSVYHLNYFSPDPSRTEFLPFERVYDADTISDLNLRAQAAGFLVQYNHPRWSFQQASDFLPLKGLWGFEVYNTGCQKEMFNGWADYEFELCCRAGMGVVPVATDDNHNWAMDEQSPLNDSFGGWSMIKAESLTYEDIFEAMKRGDVYASTGPEIRELWVEDGEMHVVTSGVCAIAFLTSGRETAMKRALDDSLTEHCFKVPGHVRFVRVELADTKGGRAFSRPYDIKELL